MYNQRGYQNYGNYRPMRERSGCLMILLILGTIGAVVGMFRAFVPPDAATLTAIQQFIGDLPKWFFPVSGLIQCVAIFSMLGIWVWKKWGWYVMVSQEVAVVLMFIFAGLPGMVVGWGIAGAVIRLLVWWSVLSGHWDNFE